MVLKEAFRYQNHLSATLSRVCMYLIRDKNVTITTEEHLRNKAHEGGINETTSDAEDRAISVPVDTIVKFGVDLLAEKERLSCAIDKAKMLCPAVDRDVAMNKKRQEFMSTLKRMASLKDRKAMSSGTAFCFNAEGNQVPYRYEIEQTTKIDFDRPNVRRLIDTLSSQCDQASNDADRALSSVTVEFEPKFNINDSFEEAVEKYGNVTAG